MPRDNRQKRFHTINSTQRKIRKIEADIISEVFNIPSTSSVSNISVPTASHISSTSE
jgi:hypothetical protein